MQKRRRQKTPNLCMIYALREDYCCEQQILEYYTCNCFRIYRVVRSVNETAQAKCNVKRANFCNFYTAINWKTNKYFILPTKIFSNFVEDWRFYAVSNGTNSFALPNITKCNMSHEPLTIISSCELSLETFFGNNAWNRLVQ